MIARYLFRVITSRRPGAGPLDKVKAKYPEGIPPWMFQRGWTPEQIDEAMQLRRKAFPGTVK